MKGDSMISGRNLRRWALGWCASLSLGLAACGGGGDAGSTSAPGAGTPPAAGAPAPTPQPPVVAGVRAWDAGVSPSTDFASEVYPPSFGITAKGMAVMAWVQRDSVGGDAERIYVSTAPAGTNAWSAPHPLAENRTIGLTPRNAVFAQGSLAEPAIKIVSNEITGDVWVLWRERESFETSTQRLMWSRYDANAQRWLPGVLLAQFDSALTQVATSRAGHVAVASAMDRKGTQVAVMAPDGQTLSRFEHPAFLVNGRMVVDDTGRVTVAYHQSQQIVLVQTGTPSWAAPVVLGPSAGTLSLFHDMAVSPAGEVLLVWRLSDGRLTGVRGRSPDQMSALPALRIELRVSSPSLQWTSQGWTMALVSSNTTVPAAGDYQFAQAWLMRLGADDRWSSPVAVRAAEADGADWVDLLANADGSLQLMVRGDHVASYVQPAGQSQWHLEGAWQNVPTPRLAHDARSGRTVLGWQTPGQLNTRFRRLSAGG